MGLAIEATLEDGMLAERYAYPPGPAATLPPHAHAEYQICLSLDTDGEYWYRGERHPVPARSVTVLHPGEVHGSRDPGDRETSSHFAVLSCRPRGWRPSPPRWAGAGRRRCSWPHPC